MKQTKRGLQAAMALAAATVCALYTYPWETEAQTRQDLALSRMNDATKTERSDVQTKDATVVGLTIVMNDGSRETLKKQSKAIGLKSCQGWRETNVLERHGKDDEHLCLRDGGRGMLSLREITTTVNCFAPALIISKLNSPLGVSC